jgi:hypothetical protein
VISPQITHLPCDLNQQQKRADARKDSVARAVGRLSGRRSMVDRLLRREDVAFELSAEDLRHCDGEDVFHSFRF